MNSKLVELLEKTNGYNRVLSNLYIQKEDGDYERLDTVIIHETGIYVIQFEEHKGEVYGDEGEKDWILTYFVGRHDTTFPNPIQANRIKLKLLQRYMELLPSFHFHSIIIFNEEAEFKNLNKYSPQTHVLKFSEVIPFFHESNFNEPVLYTSSQIDTLYRYLQPTSEVSNKIKNQYLKQSTKMNASTKQRKGFYRPKKMIMKLCLWLLGSILLAGSCFFIGNLYL